ncbi:SDR family NAD(P)-dependent oxidoreductase [Marinivivus vitaminiproducens]|uniref:SDR family NAD(P)-dependent oxidoreductase n=1 Tax=Marinivivus vitaminiproducens TaxID=3035935 RepID=UPI00279CCD46|nr:SDR family NAD(P)-dependent oxidoreductase [Geminicoccaceae bacterium SCSIO 64248]
MARSDFSTILITGATSGIGRALALAYASPGRNLALTGRDRERLDAVARACEARGAVVRAEALDILDREGVAAWIDDLDRALPLDLVIANAGVSGGVAGPSGDDGRHILAVNVEGVLNTVQPVIPLMTGRARGQIAVMSSLAAFRGFPNAPAYCASKAAVRLYGEGLRGRLARHGVGVSVICPGFVRTPLTDANPFPMPFMIEAEPAAAIILRDLARNRARIAFPWRLYALVRLTTALPAWLVDPILARSPAKE